MTTITRSMIFLLILSSLVRVQRGFRFQAFSKIQQAMKAENFKQAIPDIAANSGGVGALIYTDYSEDPKVVFKNIGDALVPLIATGLSLIPGGAAIGGIVMGVWGICSALLGGPPQKSPMELAIEGIKNEIDDLKATVAEIPGRVIKQARKEMDEKLKDVFNRMIYGEMSRNRYICYKYALISSDYSDDLKNNRTINESRRIEIVASIQDCDNFLKDTATAFVLPEYADVLWIPSTYTTLNRVAFLTEVCNYGISLQLDKSVINLLWLEMKEDIERHFEFAAQGVRQRVHIAYETRLQKPGPEQPFAYRNFSIIELETCKAQSKLLYMDREKYLFGVPEKFVISNNDAELNISEFLNGTLKDQPRHVQIFYNELFIYRTRNAEPLLNCIMGPRPLQRTVTNEMAFRVSYVPNKSYQLRVLYFTKQVQYFPHIQSDPINLSPFTSNRTVIVHQEEENTIRVNISPGKPNPNNLQRFLLKSGYNQLDCYMNRFYPEDCSAHGMAINGTFVTESVGIFDVLRGDQLNGKIIIEAKPYEPYSDITNTVIFGAELIIRPAELSS